MTILLSILLAGFVSHAKDFDCEYTIKYQPLPTNQKYMDQLRKAHVRARDNCKPNNPCSKDLGHNPELRVTYIDADPSNSGNPSRKYEEANKTKAQCAKVAEKSCTVTLPGVLASKTVEASYKGERILAKICKEKGIIEDLQPAQSTSPNTTTPTAPAKSKGTP